MKFFYKSSGGRSSKSIKKTNATPFLFKNLLFDDVVCLPKSIYLIEDLLDLHFVNSLGNSPLLIIDSKKRRVEKLTDFLLLPEIKDNFIFFSVKDKEEISPDKIPSKIIEKLTHSLCVSLPHYNFCSNNYKSSKTVAFLGHAGLGDHIVQVGLVKFLATKYKKVLISDINNHGKHLNYVYKNSPNVEVVKGGYWNSYNRFTFYHDDIPTEDILGADQKYGEKDAIFIGCGNCKLGWPWNSHFYKSNGVPYDISFKYFNLPENEKEDQEMFDYVMELYNISGDYAVVANEYSRGVFDLNIETDYPIVWIKKDKDIKKNIFMLRKVLVEAKEVHLVNSALLHLAERLPLKGQMIYHDTRGQCFEFKNPDKVKVIDHYMNKVYG